jgi:hypothetical protein
MEVERTQTLGKKCRAYEQPNVGVGVLRPPPPHWVAANAKHTIPVAAQAAKPQVGLVVTTLLHTIVKALGVHLSD